MIDDVVKTVAASATTHTQNSAKLWTTAAAIVFFVVASEYEATKIVDLFGVRLNADNAYLYCSIILSSISVAFAASELQGRRASHLLRKYLDRTAAETDRINLALSLPEWLGEWLYLYLKIPVDLVYYCLPTFGSVVALKKMLEWSNSPYFAVLATALVIVSGTATLVNVISALKWICNTTGNAISYFVVGGAWVLTFYFSWAYASGRFSCACAGWCLKTLLFSPLPAF